MNKTLSMLTYLPVAMLLISACSTMRAGEYTAGWSENQTPEVIKLSNGFSLRYLRAGRGRPLVLLHTIRTQLNYFEQLVPALKSQYQVYVLICRAMGSLASWRPSIPRSCSENR